MKIVGDVTVQLPYTLDFCAKGPDVDPLTFVDGDVETTLYFPPSMSDGTVGQSFFQSGWAWWTGTSLRITASKPVIESELDVEQLRQALLAASNSILRRFLSAYRANFNRPAIYAVVIDSKNFTLSVTYEDGTSDLLPEPESAFFYHRIPVEAPLGTSINVTTLNELVEGMSDQKQPSPEEQLLLDADWFESIGEFEKATLLRRLLVSLSHNS